MSVTCTINARKFDGTIHRSWRADLVGETDELLSFIGTFDREIQHPDLGHIPIGTVSHEFYWKNKPFNVFRFHRPDGEFMFFYCNVNLPPVLRGDELDYIDLDIDLLVRTRSDLQILDEEDFEKNKLLFGYDSDTITIAEDAVIELKEMIAQGSFPFETLTD